MGIFGKKLPAYDPTSAAAPDPSVMDRVLNAAAGSLTGVNVLAMQRKKALEEAQRGFMGQLTGALQGSPETQSAAPVGNGDGSDISAAFAPQMTTTPAKPALGINSPQMATIAQRAQMLGVPISNMLDVLKAQQPNIQYDRGFGYDQKTGKPAGTYHPDVDKGQIPLYGPDGTFFGVANANGAVQSAADMAGAVEGAKAKAQAPYQAVQTQDSSGRPMTITAAQLAGGANGTGAPFLGQSPAQTAADTAVATAGANAQINLPQSLSTANQAIGLIEQMKTHPGLDSRTGWRGMLPAIPDTQGADFDAMQSQLKGKVFLQAYGDLKGAGQITEVEGKKATDAIARLSNTQTKQGYLAALQDLENVINTGAQRAAGQAQSLRANAGRGGASRPASAARATPPAGAVSYLRSNPGLAAAFDQKYGQGAAEAVLGR